MSYTLKNNLEPVNMSKNKAILILIFLSTILAVVPVNRVHAATSVVCVFDVGPPETVDAGEVYSFRVMVRNIGPENATGVVLEYRPPLNTAIVRSNPFTEVGTKNDPEDPALCPIGDLTVW